MRDQPRYRKINSPFADAELVDEALAYEADSEMEDTFVDADMDVLDQFEEEDMDQEDEYGEAEMNFGSYEEESFEEEEDTGFADEYSEDFDEHDDSDMEDEYFEEFVEDDSDLEDENFADEMDREQAFLDQDDEIGFDDENELMEDEREEAHYREEEYQNGQDPHEEELMFDEYVDNVLQEESLEEQFLGNLKNLFKQWSGSSAIKSAAGNVGFSGTITDLRSIAKITRKGFTKKGNPYYTVSRRRNRPLSKVIGIVLHQMAFNRDNDFNKYLKTGAHYIILRDGKIGQLYDHNINVNAAQGFNSTTVSVEFAGNFPNSKGRWWHSKGTSAAKKRSREHRPTPAQIQAGRYLLKQLINDPTLPNFKHVFAHRQSSWTRSNDPGPDIWCRVGEWAVKNLGYQGAGHVTKGKGRAIPSDWKQCK